MLRARRARGGAPAAAAASEQHRVGGRGPAHRHDAQAVARRAASTMPGGATSTRSWRRSMPGAARSARSRASLVAADRRDRDEHPARGVASRSAVALWCDSPGGASRGSANDTRRHAIGDAAEPGGGVEDRADLDAAEPEPGVGADDARAPSRRPRRRRRATCRATASAREHRHRLVVAAERVPAGDRGVERAPGRAASATRSDSASGSAGAVGHHVREAARRARASLERGRDRGQLAVQRGGDDRHAVDRVDLGQRLEVLLGAADVGLEARVARP